MDMCVITEGMGNACSQECTVAVSTVMTFLVLICLAVCLWCAICLRCCEAVADKVLGPVPVDVPTQNPVVVTVATQDEDPV